MKRAHGRRRRERGRRDRWGRARGRRERGSAFLQILIAAVVLGGFVGIWRASFTELHRSAVRDPDRARARAIADAAWARARRALARGEPAAASGPLLGGTATVEAKEREPGTWVVRIRASVSHGTASSARPDTIVSELTVEASVEKGRVSVLSRREGGA